MAQFARHSVIGCADCFWIVRCGEKRKRIEGRAGLLGTGLGGCCTAYYTKFEPAVDRRCCTIFRFTGSSAVPETSRDTRRPTWFNASGSILCFLTIPGASVSCKAPTSLALVSRVLLDLRENGARMLSLKRRITPDFFVVVMVPDFWRDPALWRDAGRALFASTFSPSGWGRGKGCLR